MNRSTIRNKLVDILEVFLRTTYGWLSTNDEALGKITYNIHLFVLFTVFVLILVSHTIYPVLWFQVVVFILVFVIWIQHVVLHFCMCTSLEIRLIGKDAPIVIDHLLNFFEIPVSRDSRIGVTILITTLMAGFLGLEILGKLVLLLRQYYGASPWI